MGLQDIDKTSEFAETVSDQRDHKHGPGRKLTRREKGEVRGSGIIIGHRDAKGKLIVNPMPFEHRDMDAAMAEAAKLATKERKTFIVFQMVAVAAPEVLSDVTGRPYHGDVDGDGELQ